MRLLSAGVCFALLGCVITGCDLPESGSSKVILPEAESSGASLLRDNCSDCHAPPSPAVHTAAEWPNVIYRMQDRRRMKGYLVMSGDEEKVLLDYLQRYAKK